MRWDFLPVFKVEGASRFRSLKLVVPLVDDILCPKDLIYHKHFLNGRHMLVLVHLHTARTVDGLRMQIHNLLMHQQSKMRVLRETIELSQSRLQKKKKIRDHISVPTTYESTNLK